MSNSWHAIAPLAVCSIFEMLISRVSLTQSTNSFLPTKKAPSIIPIFDMVTVGCGGWGSRQMKIKETQELNRPRGKRTKYY